MNRARIVTFGLAGAIAIAGAAVGVGVAHLKAFNPQPDPPRFGMVGIAEGQTARLNLVNLLTPGASTVPPDPCRAELQFLDGDGNVVASRIVRLEPGTRRSSTSRRHSCRSTPSAMPSRHCARRSAPT
jgi:hypothetical protein